MAKHEYDQVQLHGLLDQALETELGATARVIPTQHQRRVAMIRMVCRNKVADFAKWHAVFDSHSEAHGKAGLSLENLWRGVDDANEVVFIFKVADLDKAKAFISAPDAKEAGDRSGVIEGDYWFVE